MLSYSGSLPVLPTALSWMYSLKCLLSVYDLLGHRVTMGWKNQQRLRPHWHKRSPTSWALSTGQLPLLKSHCSFSSNTGLLQDLWGSAQNQNWKESKCWLNHFSLGKEKCFILRPSILSMVSTARTFCNAAWILPVLSRTMPLKHLNYR